MQRNDIVSIDYLLEQGYKPMWENNVGKPDEVRCYHNPETQIDLRIVREQTMPEIYKVDLIYPLKSLKAKFVARSYF